MLWYFEALPEAREHSNEIEIVFSNNTSGKNRRRQKLIRRYFSTRDPLNPKARGTNESGEDPSDVSLANSHNLIFNINRLISLCRALICCEGNIYRKSTRMFDFLKLIVVVGSQNTLAYN